MLTLSHFLPCVGAQRQARGQDPNNVMRPPLGAATSGLDLVLGRSDMNLRRPLTRLIVLTGLLAGSREPATARQPTTGSRPHGFIAAPAKMLGWKPTENGVPPRPSHG